MCRVPGRARAGRAACAVCGPGALEAASSLASPSGISGTLRNPLGPWVGKRGPLIIRGRTEVAATWAGLRPPSGVTGHCSGDTELRPIKTPQLSQRGLPLWTGHCPWSGTTVPFGLGFVSNALAMHAQNKCPPSMRGFKDPLCTAPTTVNVSFHFEGMYVFLPNHPVQEQVS